MTIKMTLMVIVNLYIRCLHPMTDQIINILYIFSNQPISA